MPEYQQGASPVLLLEYWKPAADWEKIYEVSNIGNVRRVVTVAAGEVRKIGSHLKPQINSNGYLRYFLCVNGKDRPVLAHCLVAKTFMGPPPEGMEVNHKDRCRTNPRLSNLEYDTRSGNNRHFYLAKRASGFGSNNAVLTAEDVKQIRALRGTLTQAEIAKAFNIAAGTVANILSRRTWAWVA